MHAFKTFAVTATVAILASVPGLHAADTPEQARLREAVRNASISQPNTAPAAMAAPVAAPAAKPAPPATPPPAAAPMASYSSVPASNEDAAALRAALREKINEPAPEPAPVATPAAISAPAMAPAQPAASEFKPIEAPPSSISGSKEQKLDALLKLYKADAITPEQYHTQRAAILAAP